MSLEEYLKTLEGSGPLISKSKTLKEFADKICPETIEDFFMAEYLKKNGEHVFGSLWFFSPKYFLESKRMMSKETNLDISCIYRNIERFEVTYVHYNPLEPEKATDDSRLRIEANAENVFFGLQASGRNCCKLWSIIDRYILPNLAEFIEIS